MARKVADIGAGGVNHGRYYRANRLAARDAGFDVVDEWWPSDELVLMVLG